MTVHFVCLSVCMSVSLSLAPCELPFFCLLRHLSFACRLYAFRDIPQFRILIGGGDGTFGWVLGALQEIKDHMKCKDPPCALLPLGTGGLQLERSTFQSSDLICLTHCQTY